MLTNQIKKLVVSVLFSLLTVTVTAGAPERYSKEMADSLLQHYYPELANRQAAAEAVQVVRTEEAVIPVPAEPTPEPAETVKPVEKPVVSEVVRTKEETEVVTEEDEDLDLTPQTENSWKQNALSKAKAVLEKTKTFFNKPAGKAATAAVTVCTYLVLKKVKSALAQHADKNGTEKLKAVYNSLKTAGLGKILQSSRQSLSQDSSIKQAFVGIAVDSIVELATKALFGLTQTKSA